MHETTGGYDTTQEQYEPDKQYLSIQRRISALLQRTRDEGEADRVLEGSLLLAELGLDSLRLVEVVYELESFYHISVDEQALAELETMADLVRLVAQALAAKAVVNTKRAPEQAAGQGREQGDRSEPAASL